MPANPAHFQSHDYVIGIDIGGTNFRIGAITESGMQVIEPIRESSLILTKSNNPIEVMTDYISAFISKIKNGHLKGICLGLPGTVNRSKTTVISCPNLPGFTQLDIVSPFIRNFHVPVIVEHDVILLLSYDMKEKHLQDMDCIIALYMGTGLGNALYIHGKFLDGKNGVSGELGHIPVAGKTDICPCGNTGCMELYCAGKRLEYIHSHYMPEIEFSDLFDHYKEYGILAEFVDYMAIATATEINILDPDCILLSGGIINMKNFPFDDLYRRIHKYTRKPYPEQNLNFIRGVVNPFAGVNGAGVYMWKMLNHQ
jgi:allose kinase